MSTMRSTILRYIMDRPGQVVYKDDVMDALNLDATQVSSCVLALQRTSSLQGEIEVVVRGNAWRYWPRKPTSSSPSSSSSTDDVTTVVKPRSRTNPLTQQLRDYFVDHPNEVITVKMLMDYTGRTARQIEIGINNLRYTAAYVRRLITVVEPHLRWVYRPLDNVINGTSDDDADGESEHDKSSTLPSSLKRIDPSDVRLFEEVGTIDDDVIVIRDDGGNLYRATPL
jgi:hypothetical protein